MKKLGNHDNRGDGSLIAIAIICLLLIGVSYSVPWILENSVYPSPDDVLKEMEEEGRVSGSFLGEVERQWDSGEDSFVSVKDFPFAIKYNGLTKFNEGDKVIVDGTIHEGYFLATVEKAWWDNVVCNTIPIIAMGIVVLLIAVFVISVVAGTLRPDNKNVDNDQQPDDIQQSSQISNQPEQHLQSSPQSPTANQQTMQIPTNQQSQQPDQYSSHQSQTINVGCWQCGQTNKINYGQNAFRCWRCGAENIKG